MAVPMPTKDGDVIVQPDSGSPDAHTIWPVIRDGQQTPAVAAATVVMSKGREKVIALARQLARVTKGRVHPSGGHT